MSARKRTARQFQVEVMETRWAPGGAPGGVLPGRMTSHIGEEIPQVQVHVVTPGGTRGAVAQAAKSIGEEIPQRA